MRQWPTANPKKRRGLWIIQAILLLCLFVSNAGAIVLAQGPPPMVEVIVQARDGPTASAAARAVGGQVTHQLDIINGVAMRVPEPALKGLMRAPGITGVFPNARVEVTGIPPATTTTVYVDQDALLSAGQPWGSYGSDPTLRVSLSGYGSYRTAVRFDLSAVPSNAYVKSATASFYVTQSGRRAVNIHRITDSWTEGDVTWFNTANDIDTVADGSFRPSMSNEFISADITALVQEWVTGAAPNSGLMLVGTSFWDETRYASKEYWLPGHLPYLQVEYIPIPGTDFPRLIDAGDLHAQGIRGAGIGVAVIDTGYWSHKALDRGSSGAARVVAQFDAIANTEIDPLTRSDGNGHGTHMASVLLSSFSTAAGEFNGVAPDANLIPIKAFGADGGGSYADIIRAIDWAVSKKTTYNIRVLNLSFSAPPQSFYWDDPLNQAVMNAWKSGLVVVAAAGNRGPNPMMVGVPGNVPYVVTVGAFSDNYTPDDPADDFVTDFSSAGPTVEGFVKPELVAPGAHMLGLMPADGQFALEHPELYTGLLDFYSVAGTSQATVATSGIVALMLQQNSGLTPDEVKCKLMDAAQPALDVNGALAYSIFQQGAGLVNAYDAVYSSASGCANAGLNVTLDLAGAAHFGGRANRDPAGNYYIMELDGYAWSGAYAWSNAYAWSDAFAWGSGYAWSDAFAWGDGFAWSSAYAWGDAFAWSSGYAWSDGYVWSADAGGWVPVEEEVQ